MTTSLGELIESVESSAEWRAEKASQYPDDKRNVNSSKSLWKLAKRLRELPANDEHVAAYGRVVSRISELNEIHRVEAMESACVGIGPAANGGPRATSKLSKKPEG